MTNREWLYWDLLEACTETGCPLCRISLALVHSYLDSMLYEKVNDIEVRAELRQARGYCNNHAWMLTEGRGVVLGVAIIQHDIVNAVLEATDVASRGRGVRRDADRILQGLRPGAECPACAHRQKMEDMAIQTLLKHLDDRRLVEALAETSGLCLPHFSRALELVEESAQLRRLQEFQREALEGLRDELAELIRKHDHRFAGEALGEEGDSWLRATGIVSAEHGAR